MILKSVVTIIFLLWFFLGLYIFIMTIRKKLGIPWQLLFAMLGIFFKNISWGIGSLAVDWFTSMVFIAILLLPKEIWKEIFLSKFNVFDVLVGVVFGIVFWGIYTAINQEKIDFYSSGVNVIVIVGLWSISEEVLFRGFVFGYLKTIGLNLHIANLIQSSFFTILHTSYLFTNNISALVIIFFFGIIAGYLTFSRKSVLASICMHLAFNLLPIIFTL